MMLASRVDVDATSELTVAIGDVCKNHTADVISLALLNMLCQTIVDASRRDKDSEIFIHRTIQDVSPYLEDLQGIIKEIIKKRKL